MIGAAGTVVAGFLTGPLSHDAGGTHSAPPSTSSNTGSDANSSTGAGEPARAFADQATRIVEIQPGFGIGIDGVIENSDTPFDMGVGSRFSPLLLEMTNGATIADMGQKPPTPDECATALAREIPRAVPNDNEFYCVRTSRGKLVKMVVNVVRVNNETNQVASVETQFWPLKED